MVRQADGISGLPLPSQLRSITTRRSDRRNIRLSERLPRPQSPHPRPCYPDDVFNTVTAGHTSSGGPAESCTAGSRSLCPQDGGFSVSSVLAYNSSQQRGRKDRADIGRVAKLYASDFGKRMVEKEGYVALLRSVSLCCEPSCLEKRAS